jgi:pantoate kinase
VTGDTGAPLEISADVATRLLASHPGQLRVELHHGLPVGQGFGMSAAGATATALAVGRVVGASRSRAIETAHLADLFGGGGLGGVAAILGGGFEVRWRAGIPPFGRVLRRPVAPRILIGKVAGPIPTPRILRDPRRLDRIRRAASELAGLTRSPTLGRFWDASESFTDRAGLAAPGLRAVVRALRRRGARAAQAMFGGCFFAQLPTGPARERLLSWMRSRAFAAVELPVARQGARLLSATPE